MAKRDRTFQPMLAYQKAPVLDEIRFPTMASRKFDGVRCVVHEGRALTRSLKPLPNLHIRRTLEGLGVEGIDGELVVPDADFSETVSSVMSAGGWPEFELHAFDVHVPDQPDLSYIERYMILSELVSEIGPPLVLVEHWWVGSVPEVMAGFEEALAGGDEGLMLRHPDSPYKWGRATWREQYLLKIKPLDDDEGVIIRVEERMVNENELETDERGYAKRSTSKAGLRPAGTLGAMIAEWNGREVRVSTGAMTESERARLWSIRERLPGQHVRFGYQGLGSKGLPRFPRFQGLRHPDDR